MDNRIHPSAVIAGDVRLGRDNFIGPCAVLCGPLTVGNDNYIGAHVVIGTPAEDAKNLGPRELQAVQPHGVRIGDNNVIRELTAIHGGTQRDTTLANGCWIHSQSHIDHDCQLADGVVLAPCVKLGGTVSIGTEAQVGMGAAVHQTRRIGAYSMTAMSAAIVSDVPPCALVIGVPAKLRGVNRRKMHRLGLTREHIEDLNRFLLHGGVLPEGLPDCVLNELRLFYGP